MNLLTGASLLALAKSIYYTICKTLFIHVKIMLHTFTPSREKSWCTRTRFHKEAKDNFGGLCTALGI